MHNPCSEPEVCDRICTILVPVKQAVFHTAQKLFCVGNLPPYTYNRFFVGLFIESRIWETEDIIYRMSEERNAEFICRPQRGWHEGPGCP